MRLGILNQSRGEFQPQQRSCEEGRESKGRGLEGFKMIWGFRGLDDVYEVVLGSRGLDSGHGGGMAG